MEHTEGRLAVAFLLLLPLLSVSGVHNGKTTGTSQIYLNRLVINSSLVCLSDVLRVLEGEVRGAVMTHLQTYPSIHYFNLI